jgi:hypothetical protein
VITGSRTARSAACVVGLVALGWSDRAGGVIARRRVVKAEVDDQCDHEEQSPEDPDLPAARRICVLLCHALIPLLRPAMPGQ